VFFKVLVTVAKRKYVLYIDRAFVSRSFKIRNKNLRILLLFF